MNIINMKKMFSYLLIAGILPLLIGTGKAQSQELEFSIRLDKTSFTKGEAVRCTMTIKNTSKKPLVVNSRLLVNLPNGPHEVSLLISDPDNHLVIFTSLVRASFQSDEFVNLAPGASASTGYTISNDFDFTKAGAYSIVAYYENKSDPPPSQNMKPAWKGTLVSNKTSFSIR